MERISDKDEKRYPGLRKIYKNLKAAKVKPEEIALQLALHRGRIDAADYANNNWDDLTADQKQYERTRMGTYGIDDSTMAYVDHQRKTGAWRTDNRNHAPQPAPQAVENAKPSSDLDPRVVAIGLLVGGAILVAGIGATLIGTIDK